MTATPPLLAIIQGRKPRLRKAPTPRPKEVLLHMAVAALLRRQSARNGYGRTFPAASCATRRRPPNSGKWVCAPGGPILF